MTSPIFLLVGAVFVLTLLSFLLGKHGTRPSLVHEWLIGKRGEQ